MSAAGIMAGAAYVKLTADDAGLQRGLANAKRSLKNFASSMQSVGNEILTISTLAAIPMALAVKTFSDFDDKMRMVKAVTQSTGDQFNMLTEQAKKLGRETAFTASQVADGMGSLGRMGFNPQEIFAAIKPVMDLSTATGTDLAQSAEIAANNMRVFGMSAAQMSTAVDLMASTANGSAQNMFDLGEALKMAGPHAKNAGADLKETCAALGILANMGIKGSLAGTALGKSYKRLADPKVQDYLNQFRIKTVDNSGNLRKMRDILVEVGKVMRNMPSAKRIAFAEEVFDARGSLGGGVLSQNMGDFDLFLEKLDKCKDSAARTAEEMESGIGGGMRSLLSALEGVAIAFSEITSTWFAPLMKDLTQFLRKLRFWMAENSGLISSIGQVATAGLALGGALKLIGMSVGIFATLGSPIASLLFGMDSIITKANVGANAITMMGAAGTTSFAMSSGLMGAVSKAMASTVKWGSIWRGNAQNVVKMNLALLASIFKVQAGGKGLTAVFYAKAIAAKIAAAAMIGLKTAMDFVAAHPVTIIIAAVAAAFFLVKKRADDAANAIQKALNLQKDMAKKEEEKVDKGDKRRNEQQDDMQRLKFLEALSKKTKLTAEQMKEAEQKIAKLDPFGNLKLAKLDKDAGTLDLTPKIEDRLDNNQSSEAQAQLVKQLDAYNKVWKMAKIKQGDVEKGFRFEMPWGNGDKRKKEMDAAAKETIDAYRKVVATQKRLNALRKGNKAASRSKNYEEEKKEEPTQVGASTKELENAKKEIEKTEEAIAEKRRGRFQNEIEEIKKKREEYKKNIAILLENEKIQLRINEAKLKKNPSPEAKKAVEENKKNIAAYQEKMKTVDKYADESIKQVEDKRSKEQKKYTDFLPQHDKKNKIKIEDEEYDKQIKKNPQSVVNMVTDAMSLLKEEQDKLRKQYEADLKAAQDSNSENGKDISAEEASKLDDQKKQIEENQSRMDSYRSRLDAGKEAMKKESVKVTGGFSATDLARTFGSRNSEEKENQKVKSLSEIAKETRKTVELLRKNNKQTLAE